MLHLSHFSQQFLFWKIFHQLHFSLHPQSHLLQVSQHGVAIGQAGDTQQGAATGHGHGVAIGHGHGVATAQGAGQAALHGQAAKDV